MSLASKPLFVRNNRHVMTTPTSNSGTNVTLHRSSSSSSSTRHSLHLTTTTTVTTPRLALLQGLLAHPAQAKQFVQAAFAQETAIRTLQRFGRHYCLTNRNNNAAMNTTAAPIRPRKRRKTRRRPSQNATVTTTTTSGVTAADASKKLQHAGTAASAEHWLWKSIRSVNRLERQAAVSLIQLYLNGDYETTTTESGDDDQLLQQHQLLWRQTLQRLLLTHVVSTQPNEINVGPIGQLALEWVALLQSSTLSSADNQQQQPSRYFVEWLTRSVWTLASSLHHQNIQTQQETAICALASLCYSYMAEMSGKESFGSTTGSTQKQQAMLEQYLWKVPPSSSNSATNDFTTSHHHSKSSSLSPLACLIGSYFCMAYPLMVSSPTYTSKAAQQAAHMLAQLVEPSGLTIRKTSRLSKNKRSNISGSSSHRVTTATTSAAASSTTALATSQRLVAGNSEKSNSTDLVEGYDSDYEESKDDAKVQAVVEQQPVLETSNERAQSTSSANAAAAAAADAARSTLDETMEETASDEEDEDDGDNNGDEDDRDDDDDDDDECADDEIEQVEDHTMDEEDEDEEIVSVDEEDEEGEDEECMEDICVEDEDGDDDVEMEVSEDFGLDGDGPVAMNLDELTAVVRESSRRSSTQSRKSKLPKASSKVLPILPPDQLIERQRLYVGACMQVLSVQYPHTHNHSSGGPIRRPYLNLSGESNLIKSINKIIKPPKTPLNTKIILRRAPTQEEFFRGSLSQNPVPISSLKPAAGASDQSDGSFEPTVGDLRQHIANDLQMADSAELIEILVANKILDVKLKLRVIHDVLWRKHLMENPGSGGLASYLSSGGSVFSRGSGLSILFASDPRGEGDDENEVPSRRPAVTKNTPSSELPSLLATYRLAGVDGEATEDTVDVSDLVDPEAPDVAMTAEETDKKLETEYGITSLVVNKGRGVYVLLRSVQHAIMDTVMRIRQDDVDCVGENPSRKKFKQSSPCQALTLLRYCARLPRNRKKLLQARAPTILLTLLLEVLKALEVNDSSNNRNKASGGNPTAEALQELIENLTSDISSTASTASVEDGYESDLAHDAASMPLLLDHIETISLSPPLRSIIAKLLPFLTYGQSDLSKELAEHFDRHISLDGLEQAEEEGEAEDASLLMRTFIDTAISLPATDICSSLRSELISCGFVDRMAHFVMKEMPKHPPFWSPALWEEGMLPEGLQKAKNDAKKKNEAGWRSYFNRKGLRTVFKILTGLCLKHGPTQLRIAAYSGFLQSCHWIEATSDNSSAGVSTNGLGLLSETLLDEVTEDNKKVKVLVDDIRKKTKLRKRAIAEQRRNQALMKMHPLGVAPGNSLSSRVDDANRQQPSVRGAAASIFAPVLGLFRDSHPPAAAGSSPDASSSVKASRKDAEAKKPAWLKEAESMVEETGLKCAVCQEGRTLQPRELLGLYAYVKKVTLPTNKNYSRFAIDGTNLLKALPIKIPASSIGDPTVEGWFEQSQTARAAVESLSEPGTLASARRNSTFTSTTSAGNAIHISCHRRARQADRNHPKAPKSEWEGASLRNNRVNCNVIIPLVSSRSSSVSILHVNAGLSDYQSTVSNILGATPPSMLWPILHDIRFLLLRMAYGESLNADCGGGSLTSNCQLLFYQLRMAEMFDKDAQLDQRSHSKHARGLSAGCLFACSILFTKDGKKSSLSRSEMARGLADSAPMAALASIIFHNLRPCGSRQASSSAHTGESDRPHPKREWLVGRELFLRALLMCAGRRHVLNLNNSGCQSARSMSGRKRAASFTEWDMVQDDGEQETEIAFPEQSRAKPALLRQTRGRTISSSPTVQDFQNAFRPMITLFAILDQVSAEFTLNMDDSKIEESAQRLASVIENCQRSRSIHELIKKANVPLDNRQMMELIQMGMVLA